MSVENESAAAAASSSLLPRLDESVLRHARRIVVKVGSSLVTNEGRGLDEAAIGHWCVQLSVLVKEGRELIMVSSGAVAEGMKRLGWSTRPKEINELQAAAAVGQMGLVQMYESKLRECGVGSAQVLLTHADLADRERYLNARSTLLTMISSRPCLTSVASSWLHWPIACSSSPRPSLVTRLDPTLTTMRRAFFNALVWPAGATEPVNMSLMRKQICREKGK